MSKYELDTRVGDLAKGIAKAHIYSYAADQLVSALFQILGEYTVTPERLLTIRDKISFDLNNGSSVVLIAYSYTGAIANAVYDSLSDEEKARTHLVFIAPTVNDTNSLLLYTTEFFDEITNGSGGFEYNEINSYIPINKFFFLDFLGHEIVKFYLADHSNTLVGSGFNSGIVPTIRSALRNAAGRIGNNP